jgi:hypothetical protein
MNKLSPITPIIDDDNLKRRNGSDEEDDNDDYNSPIIMVNLNDDDFQPAKDYNSSDNSEGNSDMMELVNDNQIQEMDVIDDISEDCDEIDDVRSHTFGPVENVNIFDNMSFDSISIQDSDDSSASLINDIKIESDSQEEDVHFDDISSENDIGESESDESQNEHEIQEMVCVGSKIDYAVSDDGIDNISVGIDSDEYDIRINALNPEENEVNDDNPVEDRDYDGEYGVEDDEV